MKGTIEGIVAAIGMFFLYFILLLAANGFDHAVSQTIANLPFILLLVIGFGIQVALFVYTRSCAEINGKAEVAASGGMSVGSMVACCAHHLVDFSIFVGISGLLTLLAKFQTAFFVLAIFSNLYGITTMLLMIKKHKLYKRGSALQGISTAIPANAKNVMLMAAIVIVPLFFLFPMLLGGTTPTQAEQLAEKTIALNGVEITAKPSIQSSNLLLQLTFTTHSGALNMDLEKDAFVVNAAGTRFYGKWNGSPAGGHHRSGTLTITEFNGKLSFLEIEHVKDNTARLEWKQ